MSIETGICGPGDYDALVRIYNHYVETSHATFDIAPFSVAERVPWFSQFAEDGPYRLLVARLDDAVAGYACSTPFRTRAAYDHSVETTVYVSADVVGQGVGRELSEKLLTLLSETGLHRAYASIALPNDASIHLHESLGYEQVGVCHEVGYKFDTYWNVAIFEKCL
jgi:phosphinothricin acetyltransferase